MTHKEKCKKLKQVRKEMADQLGVDLHQTECTFQGECSGTCPKCAQEERALNKALLSGKVAVAGLALSAAAVSMTGCAPVDAVKEKVTNVFEQNRTTEDDLSGDVEILEGEPVEVDPTTEEIYELDGDVVDSDITEEVKIGAGAGDCTDGEDCQITDNPIGEPDDLLMGEVEYDPSMDD